MERRPSSRQTSMRTEAVFISSVCAGAAIGLGGIVYLRVGGVAGAFLFAVGMFIVLTRALQLFTGRMCRVIEDDVEGLKTLPIVWLGNFIGAGLAGGFATTVGIADSTALMEAKLAIAQEYGLYVVFFRGALCNVCIYLSVRGYRALQKRKDSVGAYIALFLGVAVFILAGGEHCVADMFYFFANGSALNGAVFAFLGMATLGNMAGGFFCELFSFILEITEEMAQ